MPKITINGKKINAKGGQTILSAAYEQGIKIPTLCFMKDLNEIGFCRMCVVELEDNKDLVSACDTPIKKGMNIFTDSDKVIESRTSTLAQLAKRHKFNCWVCPRGDGSCDFYNLLKDYSVNDFQFGPARGRFDYVIGGAAINQDQTKCVLCKKCVAACKYVNANVLKFRDDDPENPFVSPTPGLSFDESGCISCGECTLVCPTGTLIETDHMDKVEKEIRLGKHVIAQLDPAVKGTIGEMFGYKVGQNIAEVENKLHDGLLELGFSEVQDLSNAADLMLMEQAAELITRLDKFENGETNMLPMFTSSSPGWIRYIEQFQPNYLENLSTTKSPHMINASLLRMSNKDSYLVSVMPNTASKYEIARKEMNGEVDAVLTTREFSRMLLKNKIIMRDLEDTVSEDYKGYGKMFGSIGVETVATLNQASKILTGSSLELDINSVRDLDENIKEATITVGDKTLNVAVVHGGPGMKRIFKILATTKKQYHFIEIQDNFGGLLNAGGQQIAKEQYLIGTNIAKIRTEGYIVDAGLPQDNPFVKNIYETLLSKPGSNEAYKLLHTKFSKKSFRRE